MTQYLLIGWGVLNIPLAVYTGLGLLLPLDLPPLQYQVSVDYEHMLSALYATLSVCAILAAADPVRHRLLVIYIIISSFAHGGVMAADALTTSLHTWPGMTWGSLALFATGAALLAFYPRGVVPTGQAMRLQVPRHSI